jgi:hypothetical protein
MTSATGFLSSPFLLLTLLLIHYSKAFQPETSFIQQQQRSSTLSSTQFHATSMDPSAVDLKSLPGITKPFNNGFDPLKLSLTGSDGTLAWYQASYVSFVSLLAP